MLFLIDSVIKNGWSLAKKNFRFMFLIMLTILIIQWIFYSLIFLIWGTINTETLSSTSNIIINVASVVISIFLNIWWKNINLQIATKWVSKYWDFWNKMPSLFLKFLSTFILYILVIIILFVIPWIIFFIWSKIIFLMILAGIIWIVSVIFAIIFVIRVQFFVYFILDKWLRWHKALRQSREITKWHLRELIGFSMVKFILILFGAMLALVWLLRAIPACEIATADIYRKLTWTTKPNFQTSSQWSHLKSVVKKPLRKIVRKAK